MVLMVEGAAGGPSAHLELVVEARKGHEALVEREIVLRVRAAGEERSIQVERRSKVVVGPNCEVDADGRAHHRGNAEPFSGGPGQDHPQPSPDEQLRGVGADVSLGHGRDTQVVERKRPDRQVQASVPVEELDAHSEGADSAQGNGDPDVVACGRRLRLNDIRSQHRGRPKGDYENGAARREGQVVHGSRIIGPSPKTVYARLVSMLFLVGTAFGCAPPDSPPGLSRRLPIAVVEAIHPDTVRTLRLSDGVVYRYLWSPDGPWAIHLVETSIDARCELVLDVLQAEAREDRGRGHETVTSMVARHDDGVLVAVNADFFTPEGTAIGTEIVDGNVRRAAGARPAIAWRANEPLWIGSPSLSESGLNVGWSVPRSGGDGLTEAVGGFPELLSEGVRVGDLGVMELPGFAASRQPRTAVGYDSRAGRLWLVVVDGRQPPHSGGMTLPELATLFEALGADEALNLDGGGSSVMVLHGRPVSSPSDATGERPVVNALALRRDPSACGYRTKVMPAPRLKVRPGPGS